MDPMAPPDAWRQPVLVGPPRDGRAQGPDIGKQYIRALPQLNSVASVANIARSQSKMKPTAGVIVDLLRDGRCKANDVVIEDLLIILMALHQAG